MAMECLAEFPQTPIDHRPRKRPRWDVQPQAQIGMSCGQEVGLGDLESLLSSMAPSDYTCSSTNLFSTKTAWNASPPWREDDKDGHYVFAVGENLTRRYKIYRKMGEGTFGQVLECWDRESKEMVAIKIVRGGNKYREAAMIEIDVLQQLKKHDNAISRCVQLRNWFGYQNHICIVFEKLGPSLYDFLRKNGYRPFPIDLICELGRQLLESIASLVAGNIRSAAMQHFFWNFMKPSAVQQCMLVHARIFSPSFAASHSSFLCANLFIVLLPLLAVMQDLHLIHTDLKPENILFVSPEYIKVADHKVGSSSIRLPKSNAIKVIDFGSTTYDSIQDHNYVVSTRHYRAPEVILGLGWSYPCDIWSVGCILVELCSGKALFQTHKNLEHLAMMERVFGPFPQHLLRSTDHVEKYFRRGRLHWPEGASSRESIKAVSKLSRLQNVVMQHVDHSAGDLIDLLKGLLNYDPSKRLTAREALRHHFFSRNHRRL